MIVYLVSQDPEPLLAPLQHPEGPGNLLLEVRPTLKAPSGREPCERTACVLDLVNPPPGMQPPQICDDADIWYVVLVSRSQSLPIPWVRFCRSRKVELLSVDVGNGSDRSYRLLTDVLGRLAGSLNHESLSRELVRENPRLTAYEDLVCAVLRHPWHVREPVDLARTTGIFPEALKVRCEALHLRRVEHFITLVRWLGFELLTRVEGMSARHARLVVGISDPSNFRRQLGRVRYYLANRDGPAARD